MCAGEAVGAPVEMEDMESEMDGWTVLLGYFPDESTVLNTLAGHSVQIFGDAGQAACCEVTDVRNDGPGRRLEEE